MSLFKVLGYMLLHGVLKNKQSQYPSLGHNWLLFLQYLGYWKEIVICGWPVLSALTSKWGRHVSKYTIKVLIISCGFWRHKVPVTIHLCRSSAGRHKYRPCLSVEGVWYDYFYALIKNNLAWAFKKFNSILVSPKRPGI